MGRTRRSSLEHFSRVSRKGFGVWEYNSRIVRLRDATVDPKMGSIVPTEGPGLWIYVRYFSRDSFFTGRPGRMTIAVIAGPSYIPKFTILPCFPVASEWSNGERIQQYPAVDGNKRKASDLYDSERWFLPLHSSRDASRIGIVVMQSLTFRKGPSSQIGEGSPG